MDPRALAAADEAVQSLHDALATRDVDTVLSVFTSDAALFGSGDGEEAVGPEALRAFLTEVCERPGTLTWDVTVAAAALSGDAAWFLAPGRVQIRGASGELRTIAEPYRLSGVLRRVGDRWKWALLNGSEPSSDD